MRLKTSKYSIHGGVKKIKTKTALGLSTLVLAVAGTGGMSVLEFGSAHAASGMTVTQTVTPANLHGWVFNPDPPNSTPYEFTSTAHSVGIGSLYVQPIGGVDAHKFIGVLPVDAAVKDFRSVSYDFMIAGSGTSASANQYYLNVYANVPGSSTYYDCRYDYVPSTGSTSGFTTASFAATATPVNVFAKNSASCPSTLAEMPDGSRVNAIALNLGDTSVFDQGLAGYFDNVIVSTVNTATYDFEPYVAVTDKNACKVDGWKTAVDANGNSFKNQGACVSYVASNGKSQH